MLSNSRGESPIVCLVVGKQNTIKHVGQPNIHTLGRQAIYSVIKVNLLKYSEYLKLKTYPLGNVKQQSCKLAYQDSYISVVLYSRSSWLHLLCEESLFALCLNSRS